MNLPDAPLTWVFTGDSITQALLHTYGARGWVEHVHERVRWQLSRLEDVVINTGVSGWTAPQVLTAYEHLIGRFRPHVLGISLGTNDARAGADGVAEFRTALNAIVLRGQADGAAVHLHTPVLMTADGYLTRPHFARYADAVREVAAATSAPLVDHQQHWRQRFGDSEPTAWMDDHIHPNAAGHLAMARLTLTTLGLGELTDV